MPVLILSARHDSHDKVRALELGADDFVTKPFWPDELIARVRAIGPGGAVTLHPLMGGMDPEVSWESLHLVESKVLPALRD